MFWLNEVAEGTKKTNREHLVQHEHNTGVTPPELLDSTIPDHVTHVWGWWCRLHAFRLRNGPEPQPVTWESIAAFNQLHRLDMSVYEIELLEIVEFEYRKHVAGIAPDDEAE